MRNFDPEGVRPQENQHTERLILLVLLNLLYTNQRLIIILSRYIDSLIIFFTSSDLPLPFIPHYLSLLCSLFEQSPTPALGASPKVKFCHAAG